MQLSWPEQSRVSASNDVRRCTNFLYIIIFIIIIISIVIIIILHGL